MGRKNMTNFTSISRRQALLLGGAAAAALGVAPFGALADVVSDAKIEGSSDMAKAVKKSGPFKIGFSNGFSGNTWRTECLASLRAEAHANADRYDLIVVDGQGDISKQVNNIDDLIVQ